MEASEASEFREKAEEASREGFGRRVALVVGVLAAFLAVASLAGNQASENIILSQERATDTFNEYQADKLKARVDLSTVDVLNVVGPGSPQEAAAAKSSASLQKDADHENAKLSGLLETANRYQDDRETNEKRHRAFQLAEAAFQIGIVLASIAIVARLVPLVGVAIALGGVGVLLLLDGFLLLVKLP